MWGFVLALTVVAGLVGLAATGPDRRRRADASRLVLLRRAFRITLDEAEDRVVLARRMGRPDLAREFEKRVSALKKERR